MTVSLAEFNRLIVAHDKMLKNMVFKARRGFDEDYYNDLVVALLNARHRFDPSKGAFATWAHWIKRSMISSNRRNAGVKMEAITMQYPVDENGDQMFEPVANYGNPHDSLELVETLEALCEMKPKFAQAVLDHAIGVELQVTGDRYGVSRQRIQQMHVRGNEILRQKLGMPAKRSS